MIMLLIAPFVSVCLFVLSAIYRPVGLVKRENTILEAPIIAAPSQHWEGIDGTWSTFAIRVGTPPRVLRVLPATSWQETWVVYNGTYQSACNSSAGVSSDCAESRGGVYDASKSSTWHDEGKFNLGLNGQLGYGGGADYGFDSVGIGYDNSSGQQLSHQVVAQIVSDQFWLGMLGLGFQPSNFSDYGEPQASFTDTLASSGSISSRSWSYTAGAYYRLKSVFGSLIFGGYDASRFTPNDVRFTMAGDNLRDLVVTLRSITSTTSKGNTTLMSSPEFMFIDSTVPDLWLPTSVCQEFEKAFGLKLDSASGRYLLDSTTHDSLKALNPNITLTLSNQKDGGPTVDIVLPYAAFDQSISTPLYSGNTTYFPIRQAQDESMYTLGRTFLQEAYVTAHYNSRTFNVSQAVFDDTASPHILALPSVLPSPGGNGDGTGHSTGNPNDGSSGNAFGLSGGAIAGIIVGSIASCLIVGLLIFFCCPCGFCPVWRRRDKEDKRASTPIHEIDGKRAGDSYTTAYSRQASGFPSEVPGDDAKFEIAGNPIMHPQELEAEVPNGVLAGPTFALPSDGHGNGQESSSEETTGVSSMSSDSPHRRLLEMNGNGRRHLAGPLDRDDLVEDVVSPVSPTVSSMMERAREQPHIVVDSPTDTTITWSPRTPIRESDDE